ncbi:MAG TPA: hypothetical protein VK859_15150 [bacterium]|jgi:hypothetical protein|nr:hypothetical protein [bacterium]
MSNRWKFAFLFLSLFTFRTLFGLSQPFFSPDELQTYLIGLKWYCHGGWPYFGPDLIVTETGYYSQIPGALEALLIGLPFHLLPIPEAPFLLLNFLSLSGLAFFSLYLSKRIPDLSFFFIFTWLSLLPWNLHESTNPINPSYLLLGSLLFFLGFLEALPELTLKWLSPVWAWALMGFGLFWDVQFHSSWVLLPPFILAVLWSRWKAGQLHPLREAMGFLAGSIFPLAFLVPTLVQYGFSAGAPGMGLSVGFNLDNFLSIYLILPRFFALGAFEIQRFLLLPGLAHHFDFFRLHPWLALPGLFLMGVGWVQVFLMVLAGWFKDPHHPDAEKMTVVAFLALLLVWISFWFTSKPPLAHIYYILLPLVAAYSLYIWRRWVPHRGWRVLGVLCVLANLWFESGYLFEAFKLQSLYTNRAQVLKAIQEKNDALLGERRPGSYN